MTVDRARFGSLDEGTDALVQRRAECEGHALVGDLLRDGMLEDVALLRFDLGVHEVGRA